MGVCYLDGALCFEVVCWCLELALSWGVCVAICVGICGYFGVGFLVSRV